MNISPLPKLTHRGVAVLSVLGTTSVFLTLGAVFKPAPPVAAPAPAAAQVVVIVMPGAPVADVEQGPLDSDEGPVRKEICPGATHFYSGNKPPRWAQDMRVVCRIGGHIFLAPKARHVGGRS